MTVGEADGAVAVAVSCCHVLDRAAMGEYIVTRIV
jgi:hypothetical protein